jgi:hypothetical protein
MIYSRFGTKLTPVSKEQDGNGKISIQATAEGMADIRTYAISDLKADDGMKEINDAIGKLPWRVVISNTQPGHGKFR